MIFKLNRQNYVNNETYLFHLYHDFGCEDLEIAIYENGYWSKWLRFDFLMSVDPNEKVWKNYTRTEFIEKCNNRTILDIEILYDFDEGINGSKNHEDIKNYAKESIKILNKNNIFGQAYFSGSKSVHYSVIVPELRNLSPHQRSIFKRRALEPLAVKEKYTFKTDVMFFADTQKGANRCMIALEGAKHWKTGNIKRLLDE